MLSHVRNTALLAFRAMKLEPIGDYRIVARLGRGGMADVFLAVRGGLVRFSKLAVLKRVRTDLLDDPAADSYKRLLLDEACIAARLYHPNIVQTFEVGEHDGQPFFAMEYLEGQPVSQVLMRAQRRGIEIPVELSLRVVADMLAALDYAHRLCDYDGTELGIVHRDISPQNIFWTYAGEVKLVDFGVAKFAFANQTEAGVLKGKLGYMAPEQARGLPVDPRADVFSAGVVLWELVTGLRMLSRKTPAAQLQALLFEPLPALSSVLPAVDSAIARICDRALERDPARRYPCADAMRADLERVLGERGPHRDDLASFIGPMFADDREQITTQIRAALSGTAGSSLITLPVAEVTTTYHSIEVVEPPPAPVTRPLRPASVPPPPPRAASAPAVAEPVVSVRAKPRIAIATACVLAAAGVLGAVAFSGSEARTTASNAAVAVAEPPPLVRDPILRLCGSNTVGAELAPALVEAFLRKRGAVSVTRVVRQQHTQLSAVFDGHEIVVDIAASGTSTAFEGLAAGTCDVGMASRAINPSEVTATSQVGLGDLRSPATEHVLALDGIAVIVHRNNPVRALDRDALRRIFTGEIADWSQLGGTPGAIRVLARDNHSGTYDTFKSLVLGKSALVSSAARFEHSDELADLVASDPAAIGFVGLPYVRSAKALAISDPGAPAMLPTAFTITTEGYLLARRLYLYTPPRARMLATELATFALSPHGQAVVRDVGFVDLEVVAHEAAACDERCPRAYADLVHGARRLSVDFRFRNGSDDADSRAIRDIDRVVQFLARHPGSDVLLLGFADSSGSWARNLELSRGRAAAVARELATRGIRATAVDGFGAAMPISANTTATDRERNRRVEIWARPAAASL
jgi:phosphate transport system substrate-binding protein